VRDTADFRGERQKSLNSGENTFEKSKYRVTSQVCAFQWHELLIGGLDATTLNYGTPLSTPSANNWRGGISNLP